MPHKEMEVSVLEYVQMKNARTYSDYLRGLRCVTTCFSFTHGADRPQGTAIETPTKVTVRLTVVKNKPYVQTPHYRISTTADESGEFYGTTGVASGALS